MGKIGEAVLSTHVNVEINENMRDDAIMYWKAVAEGTKIAGNAKDPYAQKTEGRDSTQVMPGGSSFKYNSRVIRMNSTDRVAMSEGIQRTRFVTLHYYLKGGENILCQRKMDKDRQKNLLDHVMDAEVARARMDLEKAQRKVGKKASVR